MNKSAGFSLVELMVVVAMVGVLAATAVPLGSHWVAGSKISKTEGSLRQAIWKSKNAAIRNQLSADRGQPVVALCLSDELITVRERNAAGAPSCGNPGNGNLLWNADILDDVSITGQHPAASSHISVSCICFDSLGLMTAQDTCGMCLTVNELELAVGDKSDSILVY